MNKFVIVLFVSAIVSCTTAGPIPNEAAPPVAQENVQPAAAGKSLGVANLKDFLELPIEFVANAIQGGVQGLQSLPNTSNALLATVSDGNGYLTRLVTDIDGKVNDQTFRS